jgi:hypothetical protein
MNYDHDPKASQNIWNFEPKGDRKNCDSRKDAKAPRKKGKFEARNPKFETKSNDQTMQNSKQASIGFGVLDFPD